MIYDSFKSLYENVIEPMRRANPDHKRLDGWPAGGNFEVVGRFVHRGRTWKVHADSHYEPLELAYRALSSDTRTDPFEVAPTQNGDRLDLVPELQATRRVTHRHLYIYSEGGATYSG